MFVRDAGYAEQLARWGLDELAGALAFPAQLGPPSHTPAWRRVAGGTNDACYRLASEPDQPAWADRVLFLKQIRHDPPTARFLLRPSRLMRESANLEWLACMGVPCPRAVAMGESRQPGGRVTSLLIWLAGVALGIGVVIWAVGFTLSWLAGPRTGKLISGAVADIVESIQNTGLTVMLAAGGLLAVIIAVMALLRWRNRDYLAGAAMIVTAIEPSEDMHHFARQRWQRGRASTEQAGQVRRLARQLAGQLAVVHAARFVHGDLKFRNLLVCWTKNAEPAATNVRIAWIDCPAGRRLPPGPWLTHGRIKDLANLDRNAAPFVSRTERVRFLCEYLTALGGEKALRSLPRLARRIVRYNRRRRYAGDAEFGRPDVGVPKTESQTGNGNV